MRVGVMQPYFFPYIGYWQLINAVDKYVIFDDVNYINRGWINRNRILFNEKPRYFNVYLKGASQNKLINEIEVDNEEKQVNRNLKIIEQAYKKAPFFQEVFPVIKSILCEKESNLARYNTVLLHKICRYLGIDTEIVFSSDLQKDNRLRGQEKILDICMQLNATDYYNPIGGKELYNREKFFQKGIELHFLCSDEIKYKQFNNSFYCNLSIIDVMMFNSREKIQEFLKRYTLIGS